MDKNAIKKYAVWARKELISRVAQKAQQYGITETEMVDAGADSVNGKVLSAEEMQQRRALIAQINEKGYQQVMEEVAYTLVQPLLGTAVHGGQRLFAQPCARVYG